MVPHLFISLFITFAANIFTIMLFCGCKMHCESSLLPMFSELGSPVRGGGGQGNSYKDITEWIYLLMIFSLSPGSKRQMEKWKLGKHHKLVGSSTSRPCSLRNEINVKGLDLGEETREEDNSLLLAGP